MNRRALLSLVVAGLVCGLAPVALAQGSGRVASLVPAATEVLYDIGAVSTSFPLVMTSPRPSCLLKS